MPAPYYDNTEETWACDVPISLPEPPTTPIAVGMEGFAFTVDGISHGVTRSDIEQMKHPTYGPERIGHV